MASTQSVSKDDPVVSVDWLNAKLKDPNMKVLDASWYMPDEQRNPMQEYQVAHIPGALFFDIDGIADQATDLPHMLPSEEAFAAAVSAFGIGNDDGVVVYDGKGIFSAARIWWMFRVFGHERIWVLDGGLPAWRALGYNVESSASNDAILKASTAIEATKRVYKGQSVKRNTEEKGYQHIDARSKPRFHPLAGSMEWHQNRERGSKVVIYLAASAFPFSSCWMLQRLLPTDELKKQFDREGINLDGPIVTSCGTGVTACITVLGLHRLEKYNVVLYDGSWTEWASQSDTTILTS